MQAMSGSGGMQMMMASDAGPTDMVNDAGGGGGPGSPAQMLPAIDDCWLPDAEGRRYASELRIVVLDPERWRPT